MQTLVITNTRRSMIQLPTIPAKLATGTEVQTAAVLDVDGKLVTPAVMVPAGTVLAESHPPQKLLPGQNDVPEAYWDKISDKVSGNPAIKQWIACVYLVPSAGKAVTLISDLNKIDAASARHLIAECTNMQVLTDWDETTDAPGLKRMILARKNELIDSADGRPRGNAKYTQEDGPTFGDDTTGSQADGNGDMGLGHGEAPDSITATPPAPAPAAAPAAPPAPAPAAAPAAPPAPAPAPAPEGGTDEWSE